MYEFYTALMLRSFECKQRALRMTIRLRTFRGKEDLPGEILGL